jgi:hypothetical protein
MRMPTAAILAATMSACMIISASPAAAWEYQSMAGIHATSIVADPIHGRILVGTIEGFHYFDIPAGTWTERDWEGWIGRQVWALTWHETHAERVLTGRENAFFKGYIELTDDLGENEDVVYMSQGGSVEGFARDPEDADRYYACTWSDVISGEIVRSLDGGETWTALSGIIQFSMTSITTDAAGVVYVSGDQRVTRSVNGGTTWEGAWSGLPAGYGVYCVAAEPEMDGVLLASNDLGLYRSENGGDSWVRVRPEDCRNVAWGGVIASIPELPSYHLAAAVTWDDRVLLSLDGGLSWEDATDDLPGEPIDIAYSRFDEQIYVVTALNGVFRMPYPEPSSAPDPDWVGSTLRFDAPAPFVSGSSFAFTLAQPGQVTLEIFDLDGRHVATVLDAWLNAGPHAVRWEAAPAAAGVLFARLCTGEGTASTRIVRIE